MSKTSSTGGASEGLTSDMQERMANAVARNNDLAERQAKDTTWSTDRESLLRDEENTPNSDDPDVAEEIKTLASQAHEAALVNNLRKGL
ncbi:MAG: hypothetical protein WC069_05345 [Candidatus Shapirobacteria bacterium]